MTAGRVLNGLLAALLFAAAPATAQEASVLARVRAHERPKAAGGEVERVEAAEVYRMEDTQEKVARAVRASTQSRS